MIDRPILILESPWPDVPGDLTLYRKTSDAERHLEATDVINNEYFGYTLDGKRLVLSADKNAVHIAVEADGLDYASTVRKLLEDWVSNVVQPKKIGLMMDISKMTLDELVNEVGFF